jgi:hypothetical protein
MTTLGMPKKWPLSWAEAAAARAGEVAGCMEADFERCTIMHRERCAVNVKILQLIESAYIFQ